MEGKRGIDKAVFGGGCFWCTEAVFSELQGVISVMSGYSGGTKVEPTYDDVSRGDSGHAEVIKIEYDPEKISYDDLLTVFFATHDPTTRNRQGNDLGTQYRSVVFYADQEQKLQAEKYIKELNDSNAYGKPVVTELQPLGEFYKAGDYHVQYYQRNKQAPYCQVIIAPKLEKLHKRFEQLLKK